MTLEIMWKLLLLFGILTVVVSAVARRFFCDRTVRRCGEVPVTPTGEDFARAVLKQGKASEVLVEVKRRPFLALGPDRLVIPPGLASSKVAKDVAAAGLLAGIVLMARRQEKVVGWRKWAVKFGWAAPAFTTVIVVFGAVATRIPPSMAIGIVFAVLGLATLALWFTLPIERAAGQTVTQFLEDTNMVNRRSESEILSDLTKALAWQRMVPGCVEWLIPKPKAAVGKAITKI
ncbi:MAG: hypothetical protein ACSHYF_17710 [Verrucomicrobiaceae bacterium]